MISVYLAPLILLEKIHLYVNAYQVTMTMALKYVKNVTFLVKNAPIIINVLSVRGNNLI